eukprot:458110-Pelagomonas_calceolata.AAC.1
MLVFQVLHSNCCSSSCRANDDYNVTQRTIDTWAFFIQFRTRLYLLDKKWAYAGVCHDSLSTGEEGRITCTGLEPDRI